MGGLSGHMMHPHDNHNLTVGQFKSLLASSMLGHLPMTEKIDGFNIHYMKYNGEIRLARNGKDILKGGFGYNDINNRFSNDRIRTIFRKAWDIIYSIGGDSIPEFTTTHKTVNAEIIIQGTTNIMMYVPPKKITAYAGTMVIPHNIWIWKGTTGAPCEEIEMDMKQEYMSMKLEYTPIHRAMVGALMGQLTKEEFEPLGLTEDSTLYDYYATRFALVMQEKFPELLEKCPKVLAVLFDRFMGIDKTNLREIRKMTTENISPVLAAEKKIMQVVKEPLDRWVLQIGTLMLERAKGLNYEYGCEYAAAAELEDAIAQAEQNETFKRRWGYCSNKIFGMEGLVVKFKGNFYKFTGPFAPINQLLGGNRK